MSDFSITKYPTGSGSICQGKLKFTLYVDTSDEVCLDIGNRVISIAGADDLRTLAESIMTYLKAVDR